MDVFGTATKDGGRGFLFAADGCDGSGKTTALTLAAQMLWDRYGKERIVEIHQPGGTPLGAELRRVVKSTDFQPTMRTERLIMAADNAQTIETVVIPALAAGKIVLSDRWSFFTDLAYGPARGLDMTYVMHVQAAVPFQKLDGLFIFDPPFEVTRQRKEAMEKLNALTHKKETCRIEALGNEFMGKVHAFYHAAATDETSRQHELAKRAAKAVYRVDSSNKMARACAVEIVEQIAKVVG